jgi:hypothetical protein
MIPIDLMFQMIIPLFLFGLFLNLCVRIFKYFCDLTDKICAYFSKLSA